MQIKFYQMCSDFLPIACNRRTYPALLKAFLITLSLTLGGLSHPLYAQDWVQRGSDIDGATLEGIGLALSISADGTVVAIGANANDLDPGNSKTSVKVRMWNGSAWVQKGSTLYAEQAGDNFGTALSLSANGNVLAVGARTHSDIALYGEFSFSGRAYVYDWSGSDWVLRDNALIGGAAQENFGNDVSLSQDGSLLAVGAPGAGVNLTGLVRIYSWTGSSWSQIGSDLLGNTDFENFGTSVSLKVAGPETVLVVGSPSFTPSPGSDNTGRVKIFNRSGNSWNLSKTLTGDNTGDYFGFSVSLSNDADRVAIGAPTDAIFSSQYIGYARTFDFTGSDWTQSGADIVSNIVFDEFGRKLALSGDGQYVIIGARGGTGNENGRAEVYTFNTNTWQQVGSDIIGEAQNDLSGEAVAINDDGTVLVIGAPANSGNGISSGHVRFFDPGCVAPAAPTGSASQAFCSGATIAQLAATGTNIQWYNASSGGTLQNGTTTLINNTTYYASQTVGTCESTARLEVTVTINTTPAPSGNATQDFCSASTIADLVATGTDIKWYDAATNGNLLAGSTALVNNTTYFASQTLSGCESTRLAVAVTINTVAAPGSLGAQFFCNSATVADLTADGTNLKWYDVATGGTPLSGSQALNTNVELVFYASQTVNGCESADRVEVAAGVYLISAPTGDAAQVFCGSATVADLVATPMNAAEITWYADASGGTALGSSTPLVNGTTYHAEQVFAGFCASTSRLAVSVTIHSTSAPTGNATQDFCSASTIADLVATGTDIKWYDAATNGNLLTSTTALTNNTTYFASQTLNGCEGPRLPVAVTVTTTAPPTSAGPQFFCNAGTVAGLTANGSDLKWYDVASGGTPLSNSTALDGNTIYYASQTLNGCESSTRLQVTIALLILNPPTGDASQTFCEGATVANLVATGEIGTEIKWYTAASGGTLLSNTTALVNGVTYFAAQSVEALSCASANRLAVTATVNPIPSTPTGNATQTFCAGATLADVVVTGTNITWYDANTDGSILDNSTLLVNGTTYYASQTSLGCESPTRLAVTTTVNTLTAPTGEATQIFCVPATVADLLATAPETINWYSNATGGTPLVSSETLVDGTYYAGYSQSGCESPRLAVLISNFKQSYWKEVAAGQAHSLGIKQDGTLWAWGRNEFGELGDGTEFFSRNTPVQVGTDKWASISAGYYFSLGIKQDGTLWAWGRNDNGQLGIDTYLNSLIPVQVGADKWISISAGGHHSLGIKEDGTLWAWGKNENGQLGDGTDLSSISPVQVSTDKWISISAGAENSLGIKETGTLWAWGSNGYGVLGDGTALPKSTPVQIGTDKWKSISGGHFLSLGIKQDGTLWTWGRNNFGQLGDGTNTDRNTPTQIGTDKWVSISGGAFHSLGIKQDGTLWTWGYNNAGELGDGTTTHRNTPGQIGSDKWIGISGGTYHSLGLKQGNKLWAWGYNSDGQLGEGTNTNSSIPVQEVVVGIAPTIPLTTDVTQPTCTVITGAITLTTSLANVTYSFNNGTDYQTENFKTELAAGSYQVLVKTRGGCISDPITVTLNPVTFPNAPTANATQTFCNSATVTQLTATGSGIKWYLTETGGTPVSSKAELTDNTTYYASQTIGCESKERFPVAVTLFLLPKPTGPEVQSICAEALYNDLEVTAIETPHWYKTPTGGTPLLGTDRIEYWYDRSVFYAGYSKDGCESPRLAVTVETAYTFIEIAAGKDHIVALAEDSILWVMGTDRNAQIGFGGAGLLRIIPNLEVTHLRWKKLAAGNTHSLGILRNDELWSFGRNWEGQLGNGTLNHHFWPRLSNTEHWTVIAAGDLHSMGIKEDGTLWSWGEALDGKLGLGPTPNQAEVRQVGEDKWLAVECGKNHTLAIRQDGTLWAWGDNSAGQLGVLGDDKLVPTLVSPLRWLKISAGGNSSAAIRSDGTLWTWGDNEGGALGDGTTVKRTSPTQVGLDKWLEVSMGTTHAVAIKADRTLWAWGKNDKSQVGDGTTTNRLAPVQIHSERFETISSGDDFTIVLHEDGSLWGWGSNENGEVGDRRRADITRPGRFAAKPPTVAKPTLSLSFTSDSEPVLTASGGSDYIWFKNDIAIPDVTGDTYVIPSENAEGMYSVSSKGLRRCHSVKSEQIPIYITGLDFEPEATVNLYPNPAQESLLVKVAEQAQLSVVSMTGHVQQISTEWLSQEQAHKVYVKDLNSGLYILQIQHHGKKAQIKFVKQ